MEPTITTRI